MLAKDPLRQPGGEEMEMAEELSLTEQVLLCLNDETGKFEEGAGAT